MQNVRQEQRANNGGEAIGPAPHTQNSVSGLLRENLSMFPTSGGNIIKAHTPQIHCDSQAMRFRGVTGPDLGRNKFASFRRDRGPLLGHGTREKEEEVG
jgi:hypothetical protein